MIKRILTAVRGYRFSRKGKKVAAALSEVEQWDKEVYGMPYRWDEVNRFKNTNLPFKK